ncbi:hypothetical protein CLOM_g6202 [Closterium sp. NIES-68]|nr:hypothetical protein CLOM_g6202 [Closterium sp. NIES-68]GJP66587.1 hypothetical protein CLOP_g23502 [Closterium sp. NIES-67]
MASRTVERVALVCFAAYTAYSLLIRPHEQSPAGGCSGAVAATAGEAAEGRPAELQQRLLAVRATVGAMMRGRGEGGAGDRDSITGSSSLFFRRLKNSSSSGSNGSNCSCSATHGCCWCCADDSEENRPGDSSSGSGSGSSSSGAMGVSKSIPALLADLISTPQGPVAALSWRGKGVEDAPPPSMASQTLTAFGQTASFEDARGKILRVSMGGGMVVNLMATAAGSRRSGDMHNCSQHDVILAGRTNLHLKDLVGGGEEVKEYDGRLNVITIPPRVPHMFHFLEDNLMIEWWDCDFQAWYYRPYRDIVAA